MSKTNAVIAVAPLCLLLGLVPGAARADIASCAKLKDLSLPASIMALPTSGLHVTAAELTPPQGAEPEFCKVLGQIRPVDPAAPPINFEVNLPTTWNGKSIQYGGGGLNGVLITGLGPLRDDPPTTPSPLARGFSTFGTDAGHQAVRGQDLQTFAFNQEALVNHAYPAYKKTHDAAMALTAIYYGKRPKRTYFIGGSEGGREAMVAVQKFPKDYDGAVATVPVLSWTGTNLAEYRQWQAMMDGGWMDAAKVALVQRAALAACDKLDGVQDGVVARYLGCADNQQLQALRCKDGADTGDDCLSDKQLALMSVVRHPHHYAVTLKNGEQNYPAYPAGGEANPGAMFPWILPATKPAPDDRGAANYSVGDIRYFIVHDPEFRAPLDEKTYAKQIQATSALMDMNDANLTLFQARGGKLIMKANAADFLVSPGSVYRYYERIVARMGRVRADQFVRLYVTPWAQHGGQGVEADGSPAPDKVDLLPLLDAWVEEGRSPGDQLELTSFGKDGRALASWPMCRYGKYPHYKGSGDTKQSANYACRPMSGTAR